MVNELRMRPENCTLTRVIRECIATLPNDSLPECGGALHPAVARAAPRESAWHRHIVLQLSSYADQARARQAAEKLHRSLLKILRGSPVRAEQAEVHGRRVWRVVAGPVATRERGKQLCDAVHHAGQSCMVMLL
jgi:cell division septation protein DedD